VTKSKDVTITVEQFSYNSGRKKGTVHLRVDGLPEGVRKLELCDGDTMTLHTTEPTVEGKLKDSESSKKWLRERGYPVEGSVKDGSN
jgi:hypothetical protein